MLFRFLILIHVCEAFPLKCPEPAQWSTRARSFCPDSSKYFCLKNDLINGYSENCTIFDFLQPGRKHVLRGGLDADICSLERYQPWPITFYTNVSTNCIFRKSACNEQGQVIYGNGNRNTDITCRCDYTKGFDFIVKPRNLCFCVPSEEDCSCYLKVCQDSRDTLSPDYGCIHSKKNISFNQCKPIFFERINRESNQSDFEDILRIQNISTAERYLTTVAILVTISLAVLFLSYPLAKVCARCYIEHNFFSKALSIEPAEELIEGKDVSISCEIIHQNMGGTWYKNGTPVSSTDRIASDIDEKIHTLKIHNAELSDSAVYCIDFNGVKREIQLHVKDYFLKTLFINPEVVIEGQEVSISCEIIQKNIGGTWYKNGSPVRSTDRIECGINEKIHTLKIHNTELDDRAVYCIEFNGVKREIQLHVKDYFSKELSMDPEELIEGKDVSISCEIIHKNMGGTWYKNGTPVSSTDRIECGINEKIHTLKIHNTELSDSAVYCIDFNGVKREIQLQVKGYLSEILTTNTTTEEHDITITCDVLHSKDNKNAAKWFKDGLPVKFTERIYSLNKEKKCTLEIQRSNKYDTGNYLIDVDGRKRSLHLEIKPKYNIPLEIQNMTDSEKDKYKKILQEGNEKRYYIKIMILGKKGVGKSSLMRRLLQESIKDVISTDGIDIVRRSKVDIESKDWIFCPDDSTADVNERIGRAFRQTDKSDSLDQNKKNNDAHVQDGRSKTNQSSDILTEGGKNTNERNGRPLQQENKADMVESHGLSDALEDNQVKQPADHIPKDDVTKKDNTSEMAINEKEENSNKQENENQKVTEIVKPKDTENIEAVLEIGCKTKVSGRVLADCIIMDFAGHKEYYSTHQTFLTTNAIYLVVFNFDDDNPFADTVEETEQLGFWVDNIHCYAQTGQDIKDGVANPPIIMMCTKADAPEDPDSVKIKMKLQERFENWMKINQRNSHIRGPINYISNTDSSENTFNELRKTIVNIAENLSIWGEHYPVRWINLERALNQKRIKEQVLSLKNVMDLAEICSVPISDKNEVILFLKYQHEIGNLIFYDDLNLKDCVILNPSWLVDAFKCLICATEFQQFSDNAHYDELLILEHNGEISLDLCQKLFSKKSTEHAKHSELVLQVMEKFDVIVKDKSNKYNFICPGGIKRKWDSTDIITFEDICKKHLIDTKTLSPWLYIEFDFLPPALYNHLLVLCMRDSKFEKIKLYPGISVFRILDVEDRDQLVICELKKKIIVQRVHPGSEHYNSSGQKNETIPNGQAVFNNISSKIRGILIKYRMSLKCTYLIKCGAAPNDIPDYLYSEEYIKKHPKRWCNHHKASHTLDNLLKFWLDRSSPEFIPIYVDQKDVEETLEKAQKEKQTEEETQAPSSKPSETEATPSESQTQYQSETEANPEEQQQEGSKTEEHPQKLEEAQKEKQTEEETQAPSSKPSETEATPSESEAQSQSEIEANPEEQQQGNKSHRLCNQCGNVPVHKCFECNDVLCEKCSKKHNYKYQSHFTQLISSSFLLNCKFNLKNDRLISDIKCFPNGEVVVAFYKQKEVVTFSVSGEQGHFIRLENSPRTMDVVGNGRVAVLLINNDVVIVDIQENDIISIRNIAIEYRLGACILIRGNLFVRKELGIVVIDFLGFKTKHITLNFTPYEMCYEEVSQRIYCTEKDNSKLICIDTEGTIIFTFADPSMTNLNNLTIDNKGNVLGLCGNKDDNMGFVIKVDSKGDKSEIVLTNIPFSIRSQSGLIRFHQLTNSIVIGVDNEVYIYKGKHIMNTSMVF